MVYRVGVQGTIGGIARNGEQIQKKYTNLPQLDRLVICGEKKVSWILPLQPPIGPKIVQQP